MPEPTANCRSVSASGRPRVGWPLILFALTLLGWFVADASVRAMGDWSLAWFLFVFPLPYVGAFLLATLSGAVSVWPSAPARAAITIGGLALLAAFQAPLVAAGFMVSPPIAMSLIGLTGILLGVAFAIPVVGLLVTCSTCALMGGVVGGALFVLQRRLGLLEPDQIRAWRTVDIGGGALAGAFMLPAGKLLEDLVLPQVASGDGLLVRLAVAGGLLAAIFMPHAIAAWSLLRRSRLQTSVSSAGVASYALFLYVVPAFLLGDSALRPELAWPRAHLEERRAALKVAVERAARGRALQVERERMRTIPSELIWHGLRWRAPAGAWLEGDWSPLEDRYRFLVLFPAEEHPLSCLGVQAVQVREDASLPVEIVPASRARQIGYNETCRPDARHDLTICWALGNRHAGDFSERFGTAPGTDRVNIVDRLPYGDFLAAAVSPGFAASCRLEDETCEGSLAHGNRSVRFQFPLKQLNTWPNLRREVNVPLEQGHRSTAR
jgi:hypothetical protein